MENVFLRLCFGVSRAQETQWCWGMNPGPLCAKHALAHRALSLSAPSYVIFSSVSHG